MHAVFNAGVGLVFAAASMGQLLAPRPAAVQHVTVASGAAADAVAPGGSVSLWVDVMPKPNIHVYGPGAKEFTPVALKVSPAPGTKALKPKYPAPELLESPGSDKPVPVYRTQFRIVQPIAVSKTAKPGQTLDISGTLNYESCDERLCYPLLSIPINWTVKVR